MDLYSFYFAYWVFFFMAPLREALAEVSPNKRSVSRINHASKVSKDAISAPRTRLLYPRSQLSMESPCEDPSHSLDYVHADSSPRRASSSREGRLASPVPLIPDLQTESGRKGAEPTSCRVAAMKLKTRLRLAYFKVRTNQITVSLPDLKANDHADHHDTNDHIKFVSTTSRYAETPKKSSTLHCNLSSSPLKGPLLCNMVKETPTSMGAAKSLLKLGDC